MHVATHAAADRPEFAPPPQPGFVRGVVLAVAAHLLLLLALTWGVAWKRDAQNISAEAELWSAVPQQAAPKLVEPPPAPPRPVVKPLPPPPPVALPREADIALEQEKKQKALAKAKLDELERQKKAEQQKLEALKKLELAKKAEEEKKKKQQQQAEAQTAQASQKALEAQKLEALRQENLRRMAGLAGATGAADAKGTALRSSGPSDSYAGRIQARVYPNIVFTDEMPGNPTADVEVRAAPDGTIVGRKIIKSSGVKSWDEAVLRALDKTEVLPRDVDGRVPSTIIIGFRPRK